MYVKQLKISMYDQKKMSESKIIDKLNKSWEMDTEHTRQLDTVGII